VERGKSPEERVGREGADATLLSDTLVPGREELEVSKLISKEFY
jgi:hypothetical protein